MSCDQCRGRDYLCQRCKEEALAERFDGNTDQPDEWWVADVKEVYHHCPYSEDDRDVARCGEIIEAPVRRSEIDPRRYLDCQVCPECDAALEEDQAEPAVPDGGEFERASEIVTDGGKEPERFTDLPVPDRFFQQISSAEIDYHVEDWERDEIRFSAQNVPGGKFGFEIAASYSYGGYDCKQHVMLDVDGAVALRKALTEALESRGYDPETGDREIVTDGGLEEVFRRETIVETDDGMAIGEDAVPMVDDQDGATEAVLGPEPVANEREQGESR